MERFKRFPSLSYSEPKPPFLAGLRSHIKRLPPGDKLVLTVLAGIFVITCLVGLRALERSFLVEVPAEGGTLIEGIVGAPRFVNPLLALTDADRDVAALTYAGLMGIGPDGALVPVLAESYTVSEDGTIYTFILRENAEFSDGTSVTSEDVVFTVEKAQDPGLKSPEYANWANVRAEAVDARTVRFILPSPYAPFLEDTRLGILPARLWRNVSNELFPFSPLMERPVGAGPFSVRHVIRDKDGIIKEYDLVAFPEFATGRPYLDRVRLKFYANSEELAEALDRGQIKSAYGIAAEGAMRAPYTRVFGVFFNPEVEPIFAELEVRQALSIAIDRNHIVNDILNGYGTPIAGPVPPGSEIAQPPVPEVATRIETARTALTDAGWEYEEGIGWNFEGTPMPVITLRTSNVPELKAIAESIVTDWQTLGIATELELYAVGDLTQDVIRPRDYDALLFGEVIGRGHDLYAFWNSNATTDPGLNIAMYKDETVDELLVRAREANDPIVALADVEAASNRIASEYAAAFTHTPDFLYAVPKDLDGIVLTQITSPSDRFATIASWHRHSEYIWPFLAR